MPIEARNSCGSRGLPSLDSRGQRPEYSGDICKRSRCWHNL